MRDDLNKIKHPENTETLFIKVNRPKLKNLVVGIVYRAPDQDIGEFNQFSDTFLSTLTKMKIWK